MQEYGFASYLGLVKSTALVLCSLQSGGDIYSAVGMKRRAISGCDRRNRALKYYGALAEGL